MQKITILIRKLGWLNITQKILRNPNTKYASLNILNANKTKKYFAKNSTFFLECSMHSVQGSVGLCLIFIEDGLLPAARPRTELIP